MDRIIVAETPLANFARNAGAPLEFEETARTGYVPINTGKTIFKHESTIDLGGYTRHDDYTVYFRSSFEQVGGPYYISWLYMTKDLSPADAIFGEQVIVSSIPLTDDQLFYSFVDSPGFSGLVSSPSADTFRTGNRTTIIHGHRIDHALSTTIGSDPLNAAGNGYTMPVQENYYSSLEPTAADTLFVYRLIACPLDTLPLNTAVSNILVPSRRIIFDVTLDKEADIPHLMRLKRSYELANQV